MGMKDICVNKVVGLYLFLKCSLSLFLLMLVVTWLKMDVNSNKQMVPSKMWVTYIFPMPKASTEVFSGFQRSVPVNATMKQANEKASYVSSGPDRAGRFITPV